MQIPSKVRYEYVEKQDSQLNYTHGVWGGINPQGEVELNFYMESDKTPSFSERSISADGVLGPELTPFDDQTRVVVRNIHSKILINYPTAKALIEWLSEKVEALEAEEMVTAFNLDLEDKNREQ